MNMLCRKAGALAAGLALAGLGATAVQAQAAPALSPIERPALSPTERAGLEQRVQGLIQDTIERRLVRPVGEGVVERDARRLAAALPDDQLKDVAARGDAAAVIDAALAKAALLTKTLGDSNSDLLFVPVPPCRIIDTRLAGGPLAAFETRAFLVNGTNGFQAQGGKAGGCGIPADAAPPQATAAMLNFVAVTPQGAGDLRAWAYGQPKPFSSIINYTRVNIANGVIVPIAGSSLQPADLNVSTDVSGTNLVVDITGYFTSFPLGGFQVTKPSTAQSDGGTVSLNNTSLSTCVAVNSCTLSVTVTGHVVVQAWAQVRVDHTQGTHDRVVFGVKNIDPTTCSNFNETVNAVDFEVPDVVPTDPDIEMVMDDARSFFQAQSSGTVTYFINAAMGIGASAGDAVLASRMICTFYPD